VGRVVILLLKNFVEAVQGMRVGAETDESAAAAAIEDSPDRGRGGG
jgi:hypothetical protein